MDRQELINHRAVVLEVRQLRACLKVAEASMYSPSGQRFTHTPRATSGQHKTMDDVVANHIELEDKYKARLALAEQQQLRVETAIAALDPPRRVIMRARYVNGQPWRQICAMMAGRGYSERTVFRLHDEALEILKEV
jgi:DNA-directed RNA polymerase specialized sigma24 family protein